MQLTDSPLDLDNPAHLEALLRAYERFPEIGGSAISKKTFQDPPDVKGVARACAMSPRTLARRFKRSTGDSVHGYVQRVCTERAKELLVTTPEPVEQVALVIGYGDVMAFRSNRSPRRRIMSSVAQEELVIREAKAEEYEALGQLMMSVYSGLEGFPQQDEQPRYYEMLAHIGRMASKPDTKLVVAVSRSSLLGGVVYYADMAQYGSGGTATREKNASGFRLLAVSPAARGRGVGQALVQACIALAKGRKHPQLIIHTTRAMHVAWGMYERMGFRRSEDLDFLQENLQVFGFRLDL